MKDTVKKTRNLDKAGGVSRREFARRVAFTVAGGTLAAAAVPISSSEAPRARAIAPLLQDEDTSGLSADAQAEVEVKLQHIFAKYGARLSEDQKKLMRRTVMYHARMLEVIRPISVENGDAPATVLKLVEGKTPPIARSSIRTSGSDHKPAEPPKKGA